MEFSGTPWGSMGLFYTGCIFLSLMQKSYFSVDSNVIIGTHVEVVYQRTADECFMNFESKNTFRIVTRLDMSTLQ